MGGIWVTDPDQRTKNSLAYLLEVVKLGNPFVLLANVNDAKVKGYKMAVFLAKGGEVRVRHDFTPPNQGASYCTTPEHLPQLVENMLAAVTNHGGKLILDDGHGEEVIA